MTSTDTATFTSPLHTAEDLFTSTLPNDEGPDFPATDARIVPSVEGHSEPLDVLALLDPTHGLLVHVGGACLNADGARDLISHLEDLLETVDDSPTDETAAPELPSYMFPATRKWRGERAPASEVHSYATVDHRDAINLEYVATPEGPVVLVDGRRPISLDATHTLMQDMALYRTAADSEGAFQRRREAGQEQQR